MDGPPSLIAFDPLDAGPTVGLLASVTIAATTSASAMTLLPGSTGITGSTAQQNILFYKQIQVANQTAGWIFINLGTLSAAVATVAAGYPIAPGSVVIVTCGGLQQYVSVICAAGSAGGNVTFTRGQGL